MSEKTNEIRERIQKAEEKKGEPLTKKQRQKIEKSVIKKYRRQNLMRALLVTLGIGVGATGYALLPEGTGQKGNDTEIETQITNPEETTNDFKEGLKVDINTNSQEQNKEDEVSHEEIIVEILDEYKEKYDIELTEEDISYIKSKPQFLGVTEYGTYVQDYKQNTPVQEYIDEGIKDIYVIINNEDNTIISSLGKVDGEVTNIDTKVVMDSQRKEYFESDKKIDLTEGKDKEEVQEIYEALQNQYEKSLEEKENEEEK